MAVLARLTGLQRMIRAWRTDQPTELEEQLLLHQQQVHDALVRTAQGTWPKLAEKAVGGGAHRVQVGQLLMVDTQLGASVVLPEVSGRILGEVCGVTKLQTAGEITMFVPGGSIDGVPRGTSPLRIAGTGMRLFVATSKGWWSVGGDTDGTYAPTYSGESNLSGITTNYARHSLVGSTYRVDVSVSFTNTGAGLKSFEMTLPVDRGSDFADADSAVGSGCMSAAGETESLLVRSVASAQRVLVQGRTTAASSGGAARFYFTYHRP